MRSCIVPRLGARAALRIPRWRFAQWGVSGPSLVLVLLSLVMLPCTVARGAACSPSETATAQPAAVAASSVPKRAPKAEAAAVPAAWTRVVSTRHAVDDEPMRLAMRDASIDEVLQFISDSTGKTILVRLAQLGPVKITVLSDRALPRSECLDRIYEALASNGLAVIEDDEVVWVDLMASIRDSPRPPLAVAAGEDIEAVSTNGVIVSMVLPLRDARAPMVLEQISPFLPDSATVVFDAERNQLLVLSTSACAKKIRRLAAALDGVATVDESTRSDAWTRVPGTMAQGSRGQRRDIFRDPLTEEGIAAMSRPELAKALAGVAKARQRGDLNDDVRAQLKREFDALVGAINERRR